MADTGGGVFIDVHGFRVVREENAREYIVFIIKIRLGAFAWTVYRRFTQFRALGEALRRAIPDAPPCPPKRLLGAHTPEFVEQRRVELLDWVRLLARDERVCRSPEFHEFLRAQANTPPLGLIDVVAPPAQPSHASSAAAGGGGGGYGGGGGGSSAGGWAGGVAEANENMVDDMGMPASASAPPRIALPVGGGGGGEGSRGGCIALSAAAHPTSGPKSGPKSGPMSGPVSGPFLALPITPKSVVAVVAHPRRTMARAKWCAKWGSANFHC